MKANNLTISIPTPMCRRRCPYCISRMTGFVKENKDLFVKNLDKVKRMADTCGVTGVLITAKNEPIDHWDYIHMISDMFKEYPVEIQTNCQTFMEDAEVNISELSKSRIDVIAFSVDNLEILVKNANVLNIIKELDITIRITYIISDACDEHFGHIIGILKSYGIDQLSLRNPTVPEKINSAYDVERWIKLNTTKNNYSRLVQEFVESGTAKFLRKLPFGAKLWDCDGISFTHFDYCIQKTNDSEDIRSLIYLEDGHMYTHWNFKSSRIF